MIRYIYNIAVVVIIFLSCYLSPITAQKHRFFAETVEIAMKMDIDGFLKQLAINQGQEEQIERLFQCPNYRDILLFLDASFTPEIIEKISRFPEPFLFIEILDILAYNLKLNEAFSFWYFSQLVEKVENQPEVYMEPFLRFCQKSDGSYAEWFADPLTEIITISPEAFSQGLKETNTWESICGILQTGDEQKTLKSLEILSHIAEAKNQAIQNLLNCVAGKNRK